MKNTKRIVTLLAVSTIALAFVSCSAKSEYTIKFAHVVAADTPKGKAATFFAKRVKELTKGKVEVKVYPNSSLYDDKDVLAALKTGNVEMAVPSFSKFVPVAKQLGLFDLPFLFRDADHLHKVLDGEVGKKIKDIVTAAGFVSLDYWDSGFKQFSSSKKTIITPADAAGQKFRIMSSKVLEEQIKVIGGSAQVLPFSEVYSALQQKVVDATENPLANFYSEKFYEAQTSLTISNHGYLGYLVVVSPKFWDKFPEELRQNVLTAMKEATEYERKLSIEEEENYMAKLEEYSKSSGKLEIVRLNEQQLSQWRSVMLSIYPKFYEEIGKDLIDKAINTK